MSSICLSLPAILRCEALTRSQNIALFSVACIHLVVSLSLALAVGRQSGRAHILLVIEGAIYFILALLDFLPHVLTITQTSLQAVKSFDIAIGALSSLPLVLYTLFIFAMTTFYFLPILPRTYRIISKYFLIGMIVFLLAISEVGSFIGISYRATPVLAVGFRSPIDRSNWQATSDVALSILAVYHFLPLILSIYRVAYDFHHNQSANKEARLSDGRSNVMPVRGLGWIALGIKIGVIEAFVGFSSTPFSVPLARRILRLFSRTSFTVGLLLGMRSDGANLKSRGKLMISNPNPDTFTHLSPSAGAFYNLRNPNGEGPNVSNISANSAATSNFTPTSNTFLRPNAPTTRRVTLRYDGRTAPTLDMRLSDLVLPEPDEVANAVMREQKGWQSQGRRFSQMIGLGMLSRMASVPAGGKRSSRALGVGVGASASASAGNVSRSKSSNVLNSNWNTSQTQPFVLRRPRSTIEQIASQSRSASSNSPSTTAFADLPPRLTGNYRASFLSRSHNEDLFVTREQAMAEEEAERKGARRVIILSRDSSSVATTEGLGSMGSGQWEGLSSAGEAADVDGIVGRSASQRSMTSSGRGSVGANGLRPSRSFKRKAVPSQALVLPPDDSANAASNDPNANSSVETITTLSHRRVSSSLARPMTRSPPSSGGSGSGSRPRGVGIGIGALSRGRGPAGTIPMRVEIESRPTRNIDVVIISPDNSSSPQSQNINTIAEADESMISPSTSTGSRRMSFARVADHLQKSRTLAMSLPVPKPQFEGGGADAELPIVDRPGSNRSSKLSVNTDTRSDDDDMYEPLPQPQPQYRNDASTRPTLNTDLNFTTNANATASYASSLTSSPINSNPAETAASWVSVETARIHRLKSVGVVTAQRTPTPTHSAFSRDSVVPDMHRLSLGAGSVLGGSVVGEEGRRGSASVSASGRSVPDSMVGASSHVGPT